MLRLRQAPEVHAGSCCLPLPPPRCGHGDRMPLDAVLPALRLGGYCVHAGVPAAEHRRSRPPVGLLVLEMS